MRTHAAKHVINSLLTLTLIACGNEQINSQQGKVAGTVQKSETFGKTAKQSDTKFKEGSDYFLFERVRVLDDVAFTEPAEAFSLLLPKGWRREGQVMWTGPGSNCDGTNHRFTASSPDGKYSFEIYPATLWAWTSNQQLAQFQQGNRMSQSYCTYGEPMDAEHYLKNVFGPSELNNPEISDVKLNADVVNTMAQSNNKNRAELMSYGIADVRFYQTAINAKLKWQGNKKGIALCGVSIIESIIPNQYNGTYDRSITSQAAQRIIFKYEGDEEQAERVLSVIMSSIRTNPYWKTTVDQYWKDIREKKQVAHIGRIKNMDAQTRAIGEAAIAAGNARLKSMDNDMRNWERSQQSQDRIHTNFIKTIREVENYRDETGKIELSSGYNHAWSRSDGSSFIMTNNPNFDPSSVFLDNRWKEMQKVD